MQIFIQIGVNKSSINHPYEWIHVSFHCLTVLNNLRTGHIEKINKIEIDLSQSSFRYFLTQAKI
jgi:hypothetical protein